MTTPEQLDAIDLALQQWMNPILCNQPDNVKTKLHQAVIKMMDYLTLQCVDGELPTVDMMVTLGIAMSAIIDIIRQQVAINSLLPKKE